MKKFLQSIKHWLHTRRRRLIQRWRRFNHRPPSDKDLCVLQYVGIALMELHGVKEAKRRLDQLRVRKVKITKKSITFFTSTPGFLIGRKAELVDKISELTKRKVHIIEDYWSYNDFFSWSLHDWEDYEGYWDGVEGEDDEETWGKIPVGRRGLEVDDRLSDMDHPIRDYSFLDVDHKPAPDKQ